jgi:1,3-beta-glucan synthase component
MTKLIAHHKPILWLVLVAFLFNTLMPPPAQADVPFLPAPGRLVSLTPSFSPPLIRGLKVFKNNPFKFEFIMSQGDTAPGEDSAANFAAKQAFYKEEGNRLVKYFLASLTVPEKDMWVNLSPYERDRITPSEFGITEMGKEVLAQDYLLKQVTASVMYPEGNVGREFWRLIYQEAYKRFGTTNITVNTFNKVWIVPESAVVYENAVDNTVVIVDSKLKVMLEEDYLALNKSALKDTVKEAAGPDRQLSNELIRQVILPLLKKEVNTGKNFAVLRQVYNSLILALWYKNKLKQSLISKGYVDRKKINGVDVVDKNVDQEIYRQYLKSYKKGVYNYIKEEVSPTNEVIPRKYFSGGVAWGNAGEVLKVESGPDSAQLASRLLKSLKMFVLTVGVSAFTKGPESDPLETSVNLTDLEASAGKTEPVQPITPKDKLTAFNSILGDIDKDELTLADPQTKSQVVKSWDIVLAAIVNGELDLSDQDVENSVINSVPAFIRSGNGALIRERIQAYQKLINLPNRLYTVLSPQPTATEIELGKVRTNLTEEQLQRINSLLKIMQDVYLAQKPLEAINEAEVLPFQIRAESNMDQDNVGNIAKLIANAQDQIEDTVYKLSWDGDTMFSTQPIAVKIVDHINTTSAPALEYNENSHEIQIGLDALNLEQDDFNARFQNELRRALANRIAQSLGERLAVDLDTQKGLQDEMFALAKEGGSLSQFILFCNMSDQLSIEKVNSFLGHFVEKSTDENGVVSYRVIKKDELGYDELENILGQDQDLIEQAIAAGKEEATPGRFAGAIGSITKFLKENPAVAIVPIVLIALASSSYAADFNHAGGGFTGGVHSVGVTQAAGADVAPTHQPLVLDHVLHLGSQGTDVTNVGTVLIDHVTPADIQNLTGNNPITGRPYDSQYFAKNAGRIFQNAQVSIQQGVLNTAVQDVVVAYEHAHGLAEDGSIGTQVLNALNASGPSAGDMVTGILGNSPDIKNIVANLNSPQQSTVATAVPITAADYVGQGGPIAGLQPTVNSGAVYIGDLDQQLTQTQTAITDATKALQDNLNEQQTLRDQIQTSVGTGGGGPPEDTAAEQMALVRQYHLSVPNLPPVALPYQTPGIAPPVGTFQPDAVGVAWINYQLNQIQQQDRTVTKTLSPVKGVELLSYNRDYVGLPIGKGPDTFNIEPDLPFGSFLRLSQMGQGFAHFSAQSALNRVAGPLFAGQIMLDLSNYIKMHPTKGQDVRYDARVKNRLSGIVQSLTVHVVPILSHDQQGRVVEEHLYSVGLVDTLQAALGKVDGALGGKGFLGDNRSHFVTSNLGYQLKVNDYHQAFTHDARVNTDPNAIYVNVYNVDNSSTRYRKNTHNGWGDVSPSTPLDSRLDFYSATVNGFILHLDPATGKMTGQRVYTAPTFVTDAFARELAKENGGTTLEGRAYLNPQTSLMERVSSISDLKQEQKLLKGVDEQGRIIWGVLRNPASGRIEKFITDPLELNTLSRLKDNQGRVAVEFVPGKPYQAPSAAASVAITIRDYTADEFSRAWGEYNGVIHRTTQGAHAGSVDLSKRPQLTQIPAGLQSLFGNNASIFDPSIALKAITQGAKDHYGMIYFVDGRTPSVLTSMEHVKTVASLNESNGVEKLPDGMYVLTGSQNNLDGKTLVLLDDQGKAVGIIDPSDKLRQERINNLDVENQRITLWQEGLENYGVAIDSNDNLRPLLTPANEFIPARFAGIGVVGQKFGVKQVVISGNMLVKVASQGGQNTIVEILQAGQKTMAVWKAGLENYGVAIDQNNNVRPLMEPTDEFIPAKYAGDGVVGQKFGAQQSAVISGDTMVRVIKQNGKNIVAEIMEAGKKTVDAHQVILQTLAQGGVEAEDQRAIDPRTGRYKITYFAKGNQLTDQQKALNIHPESELAHMAVMSQAAYVPVKGTDKLRLVILSKAPAPRLATAGLTPAVGVNTLADVNNNYALVRFSENNPLATERVLFSDLNKLTPVLAREAFEILQMDANGNTVGRYVKMYGSGYQLWKTSELAQKMRDNFLIVLNGKRGGEFISLKQLKDLQIHEKVRQESSGVMMMNPQQQVTARVYLNRDMNGSRIEVMQADHTSLVFELSSFYPSNLSHPVAKTRSYTDPNTGLLHVVTTDLRPANKDVHVEDVYQPVHNGAPVKVYSDRSTQQERIYFNNGHEEYSVSLNTSLEGGQTVLIDGRQVEHVTGLFQFDEKTNSGYHVGLRNIEGNGWFAPVRFSKFEDGQIKVDQTGFVSLEKGLGYDAIMQRAKNSGALNMMDVYTYNANGQFDNRVVSFLVNGKWQLAWTLKGNEIAPQTAMIDQLTKNDVIAQAFAKYGINKSTVLVKTVKTTPDNVITEDYRIAGDVLEKKIVSVIRQDGVVVKTIVGLGFDPQTGEQTLSYNVTPDGQVQSLSRTIPNSMSFGQLLPKGIAQQYAQYMNERMNVPNADLATDLSRAGVSPDFTPVLVEEIPFIIQTDNPQVKGYKSIEPQISPLVKSYMAADNQARPAILEKISDILRQYHQGSNAAHFTNVLGQSTYHYLAPPNDSRGRDFLTKMSNGDTILNLWWLEGQGTSKANILPGSIVIDGTGKLRQMMAFEQDKDMVFKNAQGQPHTMRVNVYNVYHGQSMVKATYTSLGQRVSETSRYVRNRVVNERLGDQTRGQETINYDPMSPYAMPIDGVLDEDGRLTKVVLHLEYSEQNGQQQIVETSLVNEPTAPGDYKIKTQTIMKGAPVVGTLRQEEMLKGYGKDALSHWKLYFVYPGMLLGLFVIGDFIKRKRLARAKEELAKLEQNPTVEQAQEPAQERELVYPANWNTEQGPNAYGFSRDVVGVAKERFEGTIIPMLKKEPLEDVLNQYFHGYTIWRKQVMELDEPFVPTIEDLWVMFLRDADSDIFSADVSDGLNYLMHKAIEARENKKEEADIGGFIKKEYTRWHTVIELQQTSFQGMSGGTMRHVVPYDYYFTVEDLNEMFRTKGNIEWYDNLGYSLDGKQDLRGAIYDDFILTLREKVVAAKAGIEAMAATVDNNVFKAKRKLTSVPAFKDYINFFTKVQKGDNAQLSDKFSFPGITRDEADRLIGDKPLIRKTFSESGSLVGKIPLPMRLIKPAAQFLRNSYNQLTYPIILSSTVGLMVAAFDGLMTWGAATMTAAAGLIIIKALYYPLNYLMNRNVNFKSFGKPKDFWAGYDKEKLTTAQKWYRGSFWTLVISAKVAWDAFLLHNFLIPFRETLGSTYFPVIAGHQLPLNFNLILMGMLWSTSAVFLYVSSYAANYLVKPFFTFTHGAVRGLGTIKTAEDIRRLEEDHTLDRLIEQKLLPRGGAGLTDEQRANARKAIIKLTFDQYRNIRDEVSDEEYRIAIEQGRLDHVKNPEVLKNIAQSVNALIMDMPQMPAPDDNMPLTVLTPVYGEDLIYAYDNSSLPTTLDMMLNNGYTNLNFIISKAPQRWENFIERVEREGIANADEVQRMRDLQHHNGKLGEINDALKMQIRLWASYEGQPFARTLDGLMNMVRWHQLYLKISFPDWTQQQIRERTNKDIQIIWGYQIWGDVLKATDQQPDNQLKRRDTLYLVKKYYDELGFLIDIASLQTRDGVGVKVLSRYNPQSKEDDPISEKIKDVWVVQMTKNRAVPLEGKPANQMHAMSFARNKFRFTIDVNQDLDPLEAMKIPIVIQEFKNKNVAIVNVPETIFTSTFSKTGDLHAFSDRTFVTSDKRHMGMVSSPAHHGHPDVWRDTDITEHGGVSSTVAVSEDYKGGVRVMLRGRTILNREYMQWKKGRELSWTGTDGIWRKFSMGAAQLLLGRYANWMNKFFGPIAGAGEFYTGPNFYTLNTIAALGFFIYTINVMVSGISPFTAFPAPLVSMMTGVLWVGQAITVIGITQMVLEEGIRKGIEKFLKLWFFIAPFYIAHIFTYQAGFISGLAGLAAYVATGRGFNREYLGIDKILKTFSKSHVVVGATGVALTAYAYDVWRNETFLLSLFTILSFIFPMIMPFVMNPGNYPIHGVTAAKSFEHFKSNVKEGSRFIANNFWKEGLAKQNYKQIIQKEGLSKGAIEILRKTDFRKSLVDSVTYSIAFGVWGALTAPVVLPSVAAAKIRDKIKGAFGGGGPSDKAMTTSGPGGIDLGKTMVSVQAPNGVIQTAFDDPAMLRLLLNADGLAPIIYNVRTMTPSMVDHFVGVDQ